MDNALMVEGLVWYIAFLFSTTLHEASHALAAKLGGDDTAYEGGQVTIDPLPHITREPFGMVVLPVLSMALFHWPFGYASCPYDPSWAVRYPKRSAWMSLAGPAANLALVVVFGLLIFIGLQAGVFLPITQEQAGGGLARFLHLVQGAEGERLWSGLAGVVSIFFALNLILFTLNMMPVPPLDGSGIVAFFFKSETMARYLNFVSQPVVALLGILLAFRVFGVIFYHLFSAMRHLIGA